jgi:thiamine-phosphate pyrophosphorylase
MMDPCTETAVLRLLDANLNRAREAVRVMEDHARFVLNDAGRSSACKDVRHRLEQAIPASLRPALLRSRNTPQDVGTEVTTAGEYERTDAAAVARAAGKRLSEALRTIEEYAKTIDPAWAAAVERQRYEGYELERQLEVAIGARTRFASVRLYVLITASLCTGRWQDVAAAALEGGADALQLREKDLADREMMHRAREFVAICRAQGGLSIINDRPDIAAATGADGVHLGQDDLAVADARKVLPPRTILGVSTHTIEQARVASGEAPDYLAVGPMFDSPTKPQTHIAGPTTLAAVHDSTGLPLVAIGGITVERVAEVLAAAPEACLCVCGAIVGSEDVVGATRRLRTAIDEYTSSGPGI